MALAFAKGIRGGDQTRLLLALRRKHTYNCVVRVDLANLAGATWRADALEKLNVGLVIIGPLGREVVFIINGLDRTDRLAGTAINALIGVNVKHAVTLVNAVDWALFDASLVFNIHARQSDDVGHVGIPSKTVFIIALTRTQLPASIGVLKRSDAKRLAES
jgi:hypothetical protein